LPIVVVGVVGVVAVVCLFVSAAAVAAGFSNYLYVLPLLEFRWLDSKHLTITAFRQNQSTCGIPRNGLWRSRNSNTQDALKRWPAWQSSCHGATSIAGDEEVHSDRDDLFKLTKDHM